MPAPRAGGTQRARVRDAANTCPLGDWARQSEAQLWPRLGAEVTLLEAIRLLQGPAQPALPCCHLLSLLPHTFHVFKKAKSDYWV